MPRALLFMKDSVCNHNLTPLNTQSSHPTLSLADGPSTPPDPPNLPSHVCHMVLEDEMDLEKASSAHLPDRPSVNSPLSLFLTFLAGVIGNPSNQLGNGAAKLDLNLLEIIQKMMEVEATHLSHLEKRVKLLESLEVCMTDLKENWQIPPKPEFPAGVSSYARATGPAPKPSPPQMLLKFQLYPSSHLSPILIN
ncbi:uncharacterized protein VP01_1234g4 [Puccinia sorghi]|uniref:Uncharacterized protein n=1 Tax=Puccinia sorghi TaxID=27349 RepID=A0A0L6VQ04_9BASI|nr:uncharacterized protein VP01_1234g4 [Puccinia sorghi]